MDTVASPAGKSKPLTPAEALARVFDATRSDLDSRLHAPLERACALVKNGGVSQDAHGRWYAQRDTDTEAYVVNGSCGCSEAETAVLHYCEHRLAVGLIRRRDALLARGLSDPGTVLQEAPTPQEPPPPELEEEGARPHDPRREGSTIPRQFLQKIHGKDFVEYAGLLAMAHEAGLQRLEAGFLGVTSELATAWATATFKDGRVFREVGDATPQNVNQGVRAHFPRCAVTRAKARALRDALNIACCSVEEIEG